MPGHPDGPRRMGIRWAGDVEWPDPGVPSAVVAQFAGHKVAALPFVPPETVATDHGGRHENHEAVEAERRPGCTLVFGAVVVVCGCGRRVRPDSAGVSSSL